jgi:hypothetical protein
MELIYNRTTEQASEKRKKEELIQNLPYFDSLGKVEAESLLWKMFPSFACKISNFLSKEGQLKSAIYRDIKTQFEDSPLRFPQTAILAEKGCRDIFPRLNHVLSEDNLKLDQLVWTGLQEDDVISVLRNLHYPIRISIHTMMVAAIVTLLSLKYCRGIQIEIDWQSGCSPEQIGRLSNSREIYDFLFTADAGMNYTENLNSFDYSRLFTCIEETQYVIGKTQSSYEGASLVYIAPRTTQQVQYELWSRENRLPRDRIELGSISDTPNVVENLSNREVLILTRQKSRRFLNDYPLKIIGREKRGMSFSLYHHDSWIDQPLLLQQFIRVFLTEWNFCRRVFLHGKLAESGRQKILYQMLHSYTFLNAYSIASDFELLSTKSFKIE